MPELTCLVLLLSAACPLGHAWLVNRRSTLRHALVWGAVAWAAWVVAAWREWEASRNAGPQARYLALCLTGCAGVAVLGARRPGGVAWNGVVAGLLAVLLLPLAEGLGELRLSPLSAVFLAGTLAVSVLNYLPTRLGLCSLVAAVGLAGEFWKISQPAVVPGWISRGSPALIAIVPWVSLLLMWVRVLPVEEFDRLWLGFRDRFGGLWGLRVREHFNRAAANNGWPVSLAWHRLQWRAEADTETRQAVLAALQAVLKRFRTEDGDETLANGERH